MGIQPSGELLSVEDVKRHSYCARRNATKEILLKWKDERLRFDGEPLWGDEIEYMLLELNSSVPRATLLLSQHDVLKNLENLKIGQEQGLNDEKLIPCFQPEWGRHMVEATPAEPYNGTLESLLEVEKCMTRRRKLIKSVLGPSQYPFTISAFPRLGITQEFTTPGRPPSISADEGDALSSWLCSGFPRYIQMREHIVARRGSQPEAFIPVLSSKTHIIGSKISNTEYLRIEGMAHGPGCCAIQTTFQAPTEKDARWLHDQLVCIGPAMLAVTASTPMQKGYITDRDSRWASLSDCVDDRRRDSGISMGPTDSCTYCEKLDESRGRCECGIMLAPPRFSSSQVFLSEDKPSGIPYVLPGLKIDQGVKKYLEGGGMDEALATYFAHFLSHDPLFLTENHIAPRESQPDVQVFTAFQGVWPHVIFKMPESDTCGWRVEFRPMEIQLCDFDNAAFAIFMYLLSRAIVTHHLSFYVPIPLVSKSMELAQKRDAVLKESIWFRKHGWGSPSFSCVVCDDFEGCDACNSPSISGPEYCLMTLDQVMNGNIKEGFPGLVNIVKSFLRRQTALEDDIGRLNDYFDVISKRAKGAVPTPASWMRSFVDTHQDYEGDGRISERVCHDMMSKIASMNE